MVKNGLLSFIVLCAVCSVAVAGPLEDRDTRRYSPENLVNGFQDLQADVDRLTQANAQWVERNRAFQPNVQALERQRQATEKSGDLLAGDLARWTQKAKDRESAISAAETKSDEIKGQLEKKDQEIVKKQQQLEAKQEQARLLWERLTTATDKGQPDNAKDAENYAQEKKELAEKLQQSRGRIEPLEQEFDYWTLLTADPSIGVPKLTAKRDTLQKRSDELNSLLKDSGQARQDPAAQERAQKLRSEVNALVKKRLENLKSLQTLYNQYNTNQSASHVTNDEQKIQDSILALKKENKLLKEQAASLRLDMVRLDQKRTQGQQEMSSH